MRVNQTNIIPSKNPIVPCNLYIVLRSLLGGSGGLSKQIPGMTGDVL